MSTEKSFTDPKADGIKTSDDEMVYLGSRISELDYATKTAGGVLGTRQLQEIKSEYAKKSGTEHFREPMTDNKVQH